MLNHRIRKLREDEGGFTLIELLVVILIIGILAAIALPTFLSQAGKGGDATAKANLRSAVTKIEACAAEAGTYVGCDTAANGVGNTGAAPYAVSVATGGTFSSTGYGITVLKSQTGNKANSTWSVTNTNGVLGAMAAS